jgi:hypothetical protein
MMNCVRKIKSNQVWYFNKTRMDNFPTDINTILKNYNKRIQNENSVNKLIKSRVGSNGINIGNDCREYLNIDNIWICLMLIQEANSNMSRNFYEKIFIEYINNSNETITENHIKETIELCNFCNNYKQLHDQIKILLKKNQTERFKNIKYENNLYVAYQDMSVSNIDISKYKLGKLNIIKYIYQILGFKNSMDRETIISCDTIENTLQRYNSILLNSFINLCKTQFQMNCKINKLSDIILLFSNCLKLWGSIKIESIRYQPRVNGKKITQYSYKLIFDDKYELLMDDYIRNRHKLMDVNLSIYKSININQ